MTSPAAFAQQVYRLPSGAFEEPALKNPGQEPGQIDVQPALDAAGLPTRGTVELMQSLAELDEAREGYALADKMYDGDVGDLAVSDKVARLLARANINDVEDLCYARVPVDTIASKLGVRTVTVAPIMDQIALENLGEDEQPIEGSGQRSSDQQLAAAAVAAQDTLDEIRRLSQMDIEEPELFLRASKYGESYLEVWPVGMQIDPGVALDPASVGPADEESTATAPEIPESVAVYVDSPVNVRAFYDPEQPLRMTHVLKSWDWVDPDDGQDEPKPRRRATLFYPDRIERWVVKPEGDPNSREDWIPFIESGIDPETGEEYEPEWPASYPPGVDRPPFFHFRNARPYGSPEHKPAYGAQRLINKLVAAQGVTVDFQMFPQRYMLLDPKGDDPLINLIDPDNPEDDDDDPEGDGRSQFRADPSAVWKMYAQTVGQFEPADPSVFLTPLDRWIKSISELCGIPLDRFTGYTTPPSGESRRVGNEVLHEKVNSRRKRYGGTLADAYEFALRLLGYDVQVDVKWEPLGAATSKEDWDIVGTKVANGIPVLVALVEAGYPEDEVEQWLNDQAGQDLTRKVALLAQIGTAVQALAAGVGAGVVAREQAGAIVARLLAQIGEELPELESPVFLQPPPPPPTFGAGGPPGRGGGDEDGEEGGEQGGAPMAPAPPPPPPPVAVA